MITLKVENSIRLTLLSEKLSYLSNQYVGESNRHAVISNQLDRLDYVGHNGLLWLVKGLLWWKLGPP